MEEKIIDPRVPDNDRQADGIRTAQLTFKLNHTMPYTAEYNEVMHELFPDNLGEGSMVFAPLTMMLSREVNIGRNVIVMGGAL